MLYAFDAKSLKLLWKSGPGALFTSGKYNEPAVIDGLVLVGTDRIQAFGLGSAKMPGRQHSTTRRVALVPAKASQLSTPARPGAVPKSPTSARAGADALAAGRSIFQARCAACHASGQPGTPSRADLAKLRQAKIVDTLLRGVMRPMANGLSRDDANNVATFLSRDR